MRYFLSRGCYLKWLESPCVYCVGSDELYEVDEEAFAFFQRCSAPEGYAYNNEDSDVLRYALEEGLLTTVPEGRNKQPVVQKSSEPSLRYLELQLTDRCNLQCRHCYLGDAGGNEIDFLTVVRVLQEFEEMQGLRLLISGGEPLLYSKFEDFKRMLPDYAFRKILFTNGLCLSQETLEGLNVDEIQLSIDGLEAGHDFLRGRGTFRKTLRAAEQALAAGFDVSVATMVHPGNCGEFDQMEALFRSMGIKEWSVDIPCEEGRMKKEPLLRLPPDMAGPYLRYAFGGELHEGKSGFGCGTHLAAVFPDGKVAKCGFYRAFPVGHLSEGLGACWRKIPPVWLKELDCDCDSIDQCRGGCRYRAELLGGTSAKDPYRCAARTND